jgi:hypothetical protein
LGDPSEILGVARHEGAGIFDRLHEHHGARRQLPHRALHLRMAGMADQHDLAAAAVVEDGLLVHLGDERADRVEEEQIAGGGALADVLRNTVGGEDDRPARIGNLVELVDENSAFRLQTLHDVAVVDDLVAHIDGGAITLQRLLDNLDGAVDPGAEAAGRAQEYFTLRLGAHRPQLGSAPRRRQARFLGAASESCPGEAQEDEE